MRQLSAVSGQIRSPGCAVRAPDSAEASSSARRSFSFRPPQIPCGSRICNEYDRQSSSTAQLAQIALARRSRSSRSALRSNWGGGKNTAACGPRHAALTCHASGDCCALTGTTPVSVWAAPYARQRLATREEFVSSLPAGVSRPSAVQTRSVGPGSRPRPTSWSWSWSAPSSSGPPLRRSRISR